MEFATYETQYDIAKRKGMSLGLNPSEWTDYMIAQFPDLKEDAKQALAEVMWMNDRRPYYSVYPAIIEPLLKVPLNLPGTTISLSVDPLLFRFPVDRPLAGCVKSILAATNAGSSEPLWVVLFIDAVNPEDGSSAYAILNLPLSEDETIEESMEIIIHDKQKAYQTSRICVRLVLGCVLLANDPEIISPDVLSKDQTKFKQNPDQKFIDRAVRRGKRGWLIGANLHDETSPHYRRPHFALRWTGPGKKIPKIVPVKGSVVHRKKISEMPTGRLDDEVEET